MMVLPGIAVTRNRFALRRTKVLPCSDDPRVSIAIFRSSGNRATVPTANSAASPASRRVKKVPPMPLLSTP